VVFKSPVRSIFLVLRALDRNRNRSAFSQKLKRADRTAKRLQTVVLQQRKKQNGQLWDC
ncbi:hypothetical protein K443DRAFT_100658, partial [Laccaria amethystina LaAM-08-1]